MSYMSLVESDFALVTGTAMGSVLKGTMNSVLWTEFNKCKQYRTMAGELEHLVISSFGKKKRKKFKPLNGE